MEIPPVEVTARGMDLTDPIRNYINEKVKKHARLYKLATSIVVELNQNKASRGADLDYEVEILMHFPKTDARVRKQGADVYALIDEVTDVLARKAKRYKEQLRKWEGTDQWEAEEDGEETEEIEPDQYAIDGYIPRIVKRKKIEDCTPVSEAEAIEKMEMMGYQSFLFKNKKTGKFSMIYRRDRGGYGIVEPCE